MTNGMSLRRIDYQCVCDLLNTLLLEDFPLTDHYVNDYDDCYRDDNWIRYSAYVDENNTPICVIGYNPDYDPGIGRILLFEVSDGFRHMGYGSQVLLDFMGNGSWSLNSLESAEGFYKKLGFIQGDDEIFYYNVVFDD